MSIREHAIKQIKEGKFSEALETLDSSDTLSLQDVESLYVRAVCLRKLDRTQEAIKQLQDISNIDETFARAHQEAGHIFRDENKTAPAIEAYTRAVSIDDSLIGCWRSLITLYDAQGKNEEANQARGQLRQLEQLHPALQAVKSHLNRDNIDKADEICRHYLRENKQDIEGMRLLAEIASRAQLLDDAEFILESAVEFAPNHVGARFDYANILVRRQKFGPANKISTELLNEQLESTQFLGLHASTLAGVGETSEAITIYRNLIKQGFNLQHTYLLCGHAEKAVGNLDAAVDCYKNLYAHSPNYGDAYWSLANTKTYSFTDDEISRMRSASEDDKIDAEDRVHFYFALGKASEDIKDFAAAFAAYEKGNALNKEILAYKIPETRKRVEYQKKVCSKSLFDRLDDVGHAAKDPIFIVGLPRAGSTLLEQILASHSQVDGTMELPNILSLTKKLRGRAPANSEEEPNYPKILAELDTDYFRRFGEQYIEQTQVLRQGAAHFIDKMPNNFLHIGLIKLILPNAKVIDARRHPMACCFSGFKQLFAEGQEFTYGLEEIGDYYKHYVEVMSHWDEVLPGFVLKVQHEDVVSDLDTQVRRILDFCGLEFEEACLEFYNTKRSVRTPSSEQVRQPIYTSGLEHWRNFEEFLGPLKAALGSDICAHYKIE